MADADANVDVTKLTEWTDRRFGYTVLKPDGPEWQFKPGDNGFRIQVVKIDQFGAWWAMVGWSSYNAAGTSMTTPQEYADWWTKTQFPQHEFESFAPGGEPVSEWRKFGTREWTVVSAKGTGKEAAASWGAMEHRVYLTKQGTQFIYAWAVVKAATPEADKQKTWDVVEKALFSPLK